MTGQTLGRYGILETIGAGGMGTVYRAHDPTLVRDVALKMLHPNALEDAAARQRFVSEAQTLSHLNHPNICTVYEIGEADGRTFIAMEYVKGRTLSSVIPRDGLPLETMVRYGAQIADALAYAHRQGVVHRDLKSANVVITPEGHAKVLDFGLAKRSDSSPDSATVAQVMTEPGVVVGTPAYMAPEVLAGASADARSDVWALGVILHEMAAGERPFAGNTAPSLTAAIIKDPPRILPPRITAALRGIVHRCLAKEPGQRYQSASEVRAALETAEAQSATVAVATQRVTRGRLAWALASVSVVGLLLALAMNAGLWSGSPQGSRVRSVAVLPLENLSGDPEQEYFADGMTEQLTADLSRIGGLRVISRTSVMQYKKARKPLPDIARELNVDAILEGSIVRADDKVRITAKLIRGTTDENLWAQSYERDLRDILSLQGEVAKSIAREINIALTPQEEARLASGRRVDPAAHQLFLLGRFHFNRNIEDGLRKAIPYFEQAIAKDPGYAEAYVGLAEAYIALSSDYERPRDVLPKAKSAASTALKLNDSLADAHAHLGFIHLFYDWDASGAERELARAIELNPNSASARISHAGYFLAVGKPKEAVPEIRLAVQLDPLSLRTHALGTIFLIFARQYDEAIEQARRALELEPRFGLAVGFQGLAYAEQGRFAEAVASLEKAAQLDKGAMVALFRAHVHAVAGNKSEAAKLVNEVEKDAEHAYICPYEIATAYVSLRNNDKAYEWLRRGIEERADCMAWLGVEPWMEPFRSDRRYPQLLREVGLHGR
jgi:TolB-like protein/tRNA A-37 threonylcarbamoyl transferase component Bud32/Tfp pilus assembly protein PilF